jgi:hypothetical protein
MRKSQGASRKPRRPQSLHIHLEEDYPLQGTRLDVPLGAVLSRSPKQRTRYINALLTALTREITNDRMALKLRVPFKREMRDLRKLLRAPADQYLYTDDKTLKRNVLAKGSPGSTHAYWSRRQMWKMKTKGGDLSDMIPKKSPPLVSTLEKLFDSTRTNKEQFRDHRKSAVRNALHYLQFDKGVGTAFPPFHAKFLADRFLLRDGDGIVVDPCAGWGGRLLGTLCVNRKRHVRYIGIDPEKRNRGAYEGLTRRINVWLKREIYGTRSAQVYYKPFEDWIRSKSARRLYGRTDLVMTSPPYFSAENYNPSNRKQSANRYQTYKTWRDKFYRRLVKGAYDLLKPGGVFVLNIADVAEAPGLERDARVLAREVGFENAGFFKLAMSISPGTRVQNRVRHSVFINGKQFKYEPVFCFRRPSPCITNT